MKSREVKLQEQSPRAATISICSAANVGSTARWSPAAWMFACAALLLGGGCGPVQSDTADVQVELSLVPSPPVVGDSEVTLQLTDSNGAPLNGAEVRIEGNMNHAGMKPSFADLEEVEPGRYVGTLDFTMGGDWFVLVTAKTPQGETIERKIDVPGVKTQ